MSLFRVRNGHTLTNSHFHRFDEKRDIKCRYCQREDETPEHLLLKCTTFFPQDWWIREQFNRYAKTKYRHASFNQLVVKEDEELIRRLYRIMHSLRSFGVDI